MATEGILAEERIFYKLYGRRLFSDRIAVYRNIVGGNDIDEKMNGTISDIIESFKDFTFSSLFSDSNENIWLLVTAYLFRYGAHGAGLILSRTLEAMDGCPDLRAVSLQSRVNVVSLGGGPGNCVIGFCSALFELKNSTYGAAHHPRQQLKLTVVDSVRSWEYCVIRANEAARDPYSDYGNISALYRNNDVRMRFCHADLCDAWSGRLRTCLREADIILMPKLLSIMDGDISAAKRENGKLIQKLSRFLKPDALLLLVDSFSSCIIPEDWIWEEYFDILYYSNVEDYEISREAEVKYGYRECVSSKAQICVLRKRIRRRI